MKHFVSQTSTPNNQELNLSLDEGSFRAGGLAPSRNLPEIFLQQFQQQQQQELTQIQEQTSSVESPSQKVRFRDNQLAQSKKFTTPVQSQPNSAYHSLQSVATGLNQGTVRNTNQVREFNHQATNQISSPSQFKIIDLRNQQVRNLVMDSLNEIIQERKKHRGKHNQNYESIVQSTPHSLRVQNSIDNETVLIEKINLMDEQTQNIHLHSAQNQEDGLESDQNNSGSSRPPSRIATDLNNGNQQNNNGILRMSPNSQQKFFISLEKIYQEQDQSKMRSEFIEQPVSPEYTIVQAIDDSCVLFAVKENQMSQNLQRQGSDSNSGSSSSRIDSAIKLQSPIVNRNFFDTERSSLSLSDPETIKLLAARLKGIENQENNPNPRRNEVRLQQQMRGGLFIESYSTDKQFLMIHPRKLRKLTPTLKAPQISRQPSITNIDFFDLSVPYHAELLCQRLQDLRNLEETEEISDEEEEEEKKEQAHQQIQEQEQPTPSDFAEQNNNSQPETKRDPLTSRVPPSRGGGGQEIDIDLLITKLLQIPNDELLDSLFNLSVGHDSQLENQLLQPSQTEGQNHQPSLHQQGRDSDQASDYDSSGIQTPGSLSFSTPIQAKLFMERGNLINTGKNGLDLRSPSTKFNLMRKLQEVKELNNSSEEDNDQRVAGDNEEEMPRFHRDYPMDIQQHMSLQSYPRGGLELRSLNDFTRMFINEEEDEDDQESADEIAKSSSQPRSLISPQRSLNSTMNQLQLRNLNQSQQQTPPLIEILIQKLKRLEEKRMRQQLSMIQKFETSDYQSNQSSETHSPQKNENQSSLQGLHQSSSQQNILEQVIKRLERLKRSRDSSM